MIDLRYETFLTLCRLKSYTQTAKALHITQPAVTQHIQYLENQYQCKLFIYKGRSLYVTPQGRFLQSYVTTLSADNKHFAQKLREADSPQKHITFGATLSIGEYSMPDIIAALLEKNKDLTIHMTVANTQLLLEKLNLGTLDFLLVEGLFNKADYETRRFSLEKFIPLCAAQSPYAKGSFTLEALTSSPLVLREEGSGTREILKQLLLEHSYPIEAFSQVIEIGNMAAIKKLVAKNIGITFLFEAAAKEELRAGTLKQIDVEGFEALREFNFVCLKNSYFKEEYLKVFEEMKGAYL